MILGIQAAQKDKSLCQSNHNVGLNNNSEFGNIAVTWGCLVAPATSLPHCQLLPSGVFDQIVLVSILFSTAFSWYTQTLEIIQERNLFKRKCDNDCWIYFLKPQLILLFNFLILKLRKKKYLFFSKNWYLKKSILLFIDWAILALK